MNRKIREPENAPSNPRATDSNFSAKVLDFQTSKQQDGMGRVLALGDERLMGKIKSDLGETGIEVMCFKTAKSLKEKATGREHAVIYCAPLVRSEILSIHKGLRTKPKLQEMSFFAIVPNWVNAVKEREMYKRGIRMVFEWPRERRTFSSTFASALETETLKVRSRDSDASLRKAILNRMMSQFGEFNPELEIEVYNGIAIVRGAVQSLGEKNRLSKFIKVIPGVRGVVDSSLHVGQDQLPGFIRTRANQLLDEIDGVPGETLMVRMGPEDQNLTIVGTAASLQTLNLAKRKLTMFKGVKAVETDVDISPRQHARDLALAKKAQRVVNKLTIGSPDVAKVKVLRGEAFLKGDVINDITASQIENTIREMSGIKAVVNRLQVESSQSSIENPFNSSTQ